MIIEPAAGVGKKVIPIQALHLLRQQSTAGREPLLTLELLPAYSSYTFDENDVESGSSRWSLWGSKNNSNKVRLPLVFKCAEAKEFCQSFERVQEMAHSRDHELAS